MTTTAFKCTLGLAVIALLALGNLSGRAQGDSGVYAGAWVTEKVITRKAKPDRVHQPSTSGGTKKGPPPVAQREKVRLLTIQWRVLKQEAGGKAVEVNPESTFYTGDRVRFAVKVNQNG